VIEQQFRSTMRALTAALAVLIAGSACAASTAADTTLADGKAIFQTGRDLAGARITAVPPPLMPSCAACHHANGSGGLHLPGGAVSADLRHPALVTHQKVPYTLSLLERAISKGIDNEGKPLDKVMPRWHLTTRDLNDVAEYVLTALK